jgi:hypothetical protein
MKLFFVALVFALFVSTSMGMVNSRKSSKRTTLTTPLNCATGTYRQNGKCINCPKGTYSSVYNGVGPGVCVKCLPGTFSDKEAAQFKNACKACQAKSYNPFLGQSACLFCNKPSAKGTGATTCH